jgi:DNA polymerase-4
VKETAGKSGNTRKQGKAILKPTVHQKNTMVGDVTSSCCQNRHPPHSDAFKNACSDATHDEQNGIDIWKKTNGIDNNPVRTYTERKSISTEHTFDQDTIDVKR